MANYPKDRKPRHTCYCNICKKIISFGANFCYKHYKKSISKRIDENQMTKAEKEIFENVRRVRFDLALIPNLNPPKTFQTGMFGW